MQTNPAVHLPLSILKTLNGRRLRVCGISPLGEKKVYEEKYSSMNQTFKYWKTEIMRIKENGDDADDELRWATGGQSEWDCIWQGSPYTSAAYRKEAFVMRW